ncbi:MAG: rod shape-determining protein MreC [Flavobacteriales bacterium CG_4_10_14_0_2_um_filter_32_8]|nr:MAG: rod shape-determining protein MreC [Flavobacteriales bacterium CG_4_10_14_0_2_um_filter_32_8]
MRNLIQFFTKNSYVFIFLFLLTISFVLLVKNNNYQNSKVLNSSNFLIGNLYLTVDNIYDYFELKEVNKKLAAQNAHLQSTNIRSFEKIFGTTVIIEDTSYSQKYIYLSAKAINSTTNNRENYITLDKGALNGIKAGMGVVSPDGVVGTVKNVSQNFCSVMSVLHEKNAVSAKIKKSGYIGSIVWKLGDYRIAQLKDIPNHVKLQIGDTIITSGYSMVYPKGILIGRVKEFDLPEGENFFNIKVEFSVDYKKLSHVYIIKSLMKEEQQKLEALNVIEK